MPHGLSPLGGLNRRKLIREIALREPGTTNTALAKKYGVSPAAITQFVKRNAAEIQAVADKADDEFAGILIASKAFRLAAYQELFEMALTPQPKITAGGNVAYIEDPQDPEKQVMVTEVDIRAAQSALKSAAEELGHLATRMQMSGTLDTTTVYRIEGVGPEELT